MKQAFTFSGVGQRLVESPTHGSRKVQTVLASETGFETKRPSIRNGAQIRYARELRSSSR